MYGECKISEKKKPFESTNRRIWNVYVLAIAIEKPFWVDCLKSTNVYKRKKKKENLKVVFHVIIISQCNQTAR